MCFILSGNPQCLTYLHRIDTPHVLQVLCNHFYANTACIQGFKPLLREGHDFQLLDDFRDTHCIRISTNTDPEPSTLRSAFGLMGSPEVKPKLLSVISKNLLQLLNKAVTSPEYQSAVVTLQGGDAMQAMELMQQVLLPVSNVQYTTADSDTLLSSYLTIRPSTLR